MSRTDLVALLYIVAFALFIYGLMVKEGELSLDFEDEVIAGACITRGGEIVHARAKEVADGPAH